MNRADLIGRVTKDVELKRTPNGIPVVTFDLAVDRPKNNEGKKETDFLRIVAWQKLAENCAKYLKKGRQVGVEGRIQTRSYDTNEGNKKYVVEIVANSVEFLGSKDKEDDSELDPKLNDESEN